MIEVSHNTNQEKAEEFPIVIKTLMGKQYYTLRAAKELFFKLKSIIKQIEEKENNSLANNPKP